MILYFAGFVAPTPEPEQSCLKPLGMESGQIPNSAITASSELPPNPYWAPSNSRLHFKGGHAPLRYGAWIPRKQDNNQWLQVDFGTKTKVTAISTQGYYTARHWVKSYSLRYSNDGSYFQQYQPQSYTKVAFSSLLSIDRC